MANWRRTDDLLGAAIGGGALPSLVAGVSDRNGVVYRFARGGLDRNVDFDTIFWIASMTKALTSIAAMQLVEDGRLPLDTPIGEVVPALARRQILSGFDGAGRPVMRDAEVPMTLAHLLSHTSGFSENVWSADMLRYVETTGTPAGGTARLAALDLPLLFEPGSAWSYGISHDWVGQAVEKGGGKRLDRWFADHLFGPLGMKDTTYFPHGAQLARMATVYARQADGTLVPFERKLPAEREFISGGGTIHSTAGDYLAFLRMLLNDGRAGGGQVLRPETVARLSQNRTPGMVVSKLDPAIPSMSNAVELLPGRAKGWGLGTMVNFETLPTGRRAGSLAWAGLPNTWFWVDRDAGVAGVLMTQILPFADKAVLDLFERFEGSVYAALDL
ncbi:MAG: serine hydrolase domain-containing protein [Rhizobiaceae bacterium]